MAAPLTTVVIPVRDENHKTLVKLLYDLDRYGYPTIVVDDGSLVPVVGADVRFETSRGYGAAVKAGIDLARTDLVCTMDGDGQHTAYDIKRLEECFCWLPKTSMIIGDRRIQERGKRYWGRKGLNWTASLFARHYIPDLNSGLRIFRRSAIMGYIPILCEGFSFTTSLTLAMLADGYTVEWIPIKVSPRSTGMSKVRVWRDGWITLKTIFWIGIALRTRKLRAWLRSLR